MSKEMLKNIVRRLLSGSDSEIVIEVDNKINSGAFMKSKQILSDIERMMRIQKLEMNVRKMGICRSSF